MALCARCAGGACLISSPAREGTGVDARPGGLGKGLPDVWISARGQGFLIYGPGWSGVYPAHAGGA